MADKAPYVKPRLLDLFCGAGGAAVGYARAGFTVVGVDIKPQPHYPFDYAEGDALKLLEEFPDWSLFDAIHASPPCQGYMRSGTLRKGDYPRLIGPVRDLLASTGLPWVIENVPGAEMRADIILCGSMFGLAVRRHRWFETSWPVAPWTLACRHDEPITGVYGHCHGKGGAWRHGSRPMLPSSAAVWSQEMGIDWMASRELTQAIPPAYTEFVGRQLLEEVTACARR